jgi:hypothetical protein
MTTVNKSIYPPPPPFYALYAHPPPPPTPPAAVPHSVDGANDATAATSAAAAAAWFAQLPIDIYQPPPPLREPFMKFGEVQSADYEVHELPPDVPPLYVNQPNATAAERATAAASSNVLSTAAASPSSPPSSYPSIVDYSLSLRILNRQYLLRYLSLLSSLVPLPGSALSPASPEANPAEHLEADLKALSEMASNFALLLTKIRPHQANQTLLQVVMKQIERRKQKRAKVQQTIADARAFLAQHGCTYAEGSNDIEPLPPTASRSAAASGDAMDIDSHVDSKPAASAHAKPASAAAQMDPVAQLQAYLDAIPLDAK